MIGLFASIAAVSPAGCNPPPGASQLWPTPEIRWLIIGEDHGTDQEPIAFQNVVCEASVTRKVAVAVEQPISEQPKINEFIRSNGSVAARSTFLKSAIWQNQFKDGRSSKAQFRLFEALRKLYVEHKISGVFAFQPNTSFASPADYEQAMADRLKTLSTKGFVIAFVGNVHAMRTKVSFSQPPYMPMAGWLPRGQTMTAAFKMNGGAQWACSSITDCGSVKMGSSDGSAVAKTVILSGGDLAYSAKVYLGQTATASPPQVPFTLTRIK